MFLRQLNILFQSSKFMVTMQNLLNMLAFQGKLFSDTESIQTRAEAAVLLKQLDFPVCTVFPIFHFCLSVSWSAHHEEGLCIL